MSLLVGLAMAGAVAPAVAAEGPTPPVSQKKPAKARIGKVPFRVVTLMPDTGQALVFDRDRNAHVLVAVGDRVGGFDITEIEDDHLVVARAGRELVLVVDPQAPQPGPDTVVAPRPADPAGPADPYAAPAPAAEPKGLAALLDPYLDVLDPYGTAGIREVLAPPDQRVAPAPAVTDPYAGPTEPKVVPAPAAAKPVTPVPAPGSNASATADGRADAIRRDTLTIQRRELEAALADFDKLGKEIGFTRHDRGVRLGKIAGGSYFFTLGLRSGDVVTAIDGKPLRSLDDAAAAYARLGSARQLAIDVDRGTARGTLRFALK